MTSREKNKLQVPSFATRWRIRLRNLYRRFKYLHGDPHYIAMGLALGVFVGITPTIPFHTVLAIGLAFVFKGSKAGAAIGVWVSNPITIPPLYIGSYKFGNLLLGKEIPFNPALESLIELLKQGLDISVAMMLGGVVLGILPAITTYFVALLFFTKMRSRAQRKAMFSTTKAEKQALADECNN